MVLKQCTQRWLQSHLKRNVSDVCSKSEEAAPDVFFGMLGNDPQPLQRVSLSEVVLEQERKHTEERTASGAPSE